MEKIDSVKEVKMKLMWRNLLNEWNAAEAAAIENVLE